MKRIIVFNSSFFNLSETFIYRQVIGLEGNFHIGLLASSFKNEPIFDTGVVEKFKIPTMGMVKRFGFLLLRKLTGKKTAYSSFNADYVDVVLRDSRPDLIHVHYGGNALKVLPLAKRNKIPLIVSFHGKDASEKLRDVDYKKRLPALFDYARVIVLCSPHMVDTLGLGKWLSKVHIVPYGIDTNDFSPIKTSTLGKKELSILHAGRIVPKKGVLDLISVFALLREKHTNLRLQILGDGKERKRCEALVNHSGIAEFVTFYGAQPQAKVKALMNACDIFVLNSRTDDSGDMEGLPNAILEAMCLQKPVVSTFHAGIPQAIESGTNGLLVPERNNIELASAIEKLINNPSLRLALGKNARETILHKFTVERMQRQLCSILAE